MHEHIAVRLKWKHYEIKEEGALFLGGTGLRLNKAQSAGGAKKVPVLERLQKSHDRVGYRETTFKKCNRRSLQACMTSTETFKLIQVVEY